MKLDKNTKAKIDRFFEQITPDELLMLAVEEYGFEIEAGLSASGDFLRVLRVVPVGSAPTLISSDGISPISFAC